MDRAAQRFEPGERALLLGRLAFLRGAYATTRSAVASSVVGLRVDDVAPSMSAWQEDRDASDRLLADASFDTVSPGDGMTLRCTS
jgi:hypothetical protein